jgi:hypothetical protein
MGAEDAGPAPQTRWDQPGAALGGSVPGPSGLRGRKRKKYQEACNYLRKRKKYLRYEESRRQGLPLGSGVTKALCKTISTQRLKLSGMHWGKAGAQRILDLRVLLLNGVWEQAFMSVLRSVKEAKVPTGRSMLLDTAHHGDGTPCRLKPQRRIAVNTCL